MLKKINKLFTFTQEAYQKTVKKISQQIEIQLPRTVQTECSKIIKWKNGTTYVGQCKGQIMQGNGKLMFPNGDYYEGFFKQNNFHGLGKYHGQDGIYQGQWENGIKSGNAYEKTPQGTIFKGRYINGVKEGMGVFQWSDGSYYEGLFKNDKMEGPGKIVYADGSYLQGQFKQNSLWGLGKQCDKEGKTYIGFFENGIKNGSGQLIKDNQIIQGFWQEGHLVGEANIVNSWASCTCAKFQQNILILITDQQYQELRDRRQSKVNSFDQTI